jgi:hypothetical protein
MKKNIHMHIHIHNMFPKFIIFKDTYSKGNTNKKYK